MKTIFVLIFGILSCTNQIKTPNKEKVFIDISDVITKNSDNKVELIEIKETNKIFNDDDDNINEFEFKGNVKFLKDGYSAIYKNFGFKKGFLLINDEKPNRLIDAKYYEKVNQNEVKSITGKIIYRNTEKGWMYDYINIKLINNKQ